MANYEIVATRFSPGFVQMRIADATDLSAATSWLQFQVPLKELRDPENRQNQLGNVETSLLAEVHLAALHCVRDIIAAEIQRLSKLASRSR